MKMSPFFWVGNLSVRGRNRVPRILFYLISRFFASTGDRFFYSSLAFFSFLLRKTGT